MPIKVADGAESPVIVLFRHDLRIADNRALYTAVHSERPILPLFVLDEESRGMRHLGGARRWWLHRSLERLAEGLKKAGSELVLRRGPMCQVVDDVVSNTGAALVLWNRRYDPAGAAIDDELARRLGRRQVGFESFEGQLLHEPSRLRTSTGGFYKVYSPFWRALASEHHPRPPIAAPRRVKGYAGNLASESLSSWNLLPSEPDWSGGLEQEWTPGEDGAHRRLDCFLSEIVEGYGTNRDIPGAVTTSRLSPHLAHGEITPFQIWHSLENHAHEGAGHDVEKFRKELVWREFSHHLFFHNPDLARKNYNRDFDAFPWKSDGKLLRAWQQGRTGYPIVDAGMRELWRTGWMHNRVRLVCASFLAKHLLQDWREGEKWFWDTLVDADPASNAANWQWVAGSGADAAPYFRIFNPVLQGEKFDGAGDYVRKFVSELGSLPDRFIHKPTDAPEKVLRDAGLKLGADYPVAIVEHRGARDRAMAAYNSLKGNA